MSEARGGRKKGSSEKKKSWSSLAGGSNEKKKTGNFSSIYLERRLVVEGVEGHLSLLELERDLLADDLRWGRRGEREGER